MYDLLFFTYLLSNSQLTNYQQLLMKLKCNNYVVLCSKFELLIFNFILEIVL